MKFYIVIWWSGWDTIKVVHISPTRKDAKTFAKNFHDGPENCDIQEYEMKNLARFLLGHIRDKMNPTTPGTKFAELYQCKIGSEHNSNKHRSCKWCYNNDYEVYLDCHAKGATPCLAS